MPFEYNQSLGGNNAVPVVTTWPLSGTGAYNVGDLLSLDTTTGYMGTVAAGDPGTVAGVSAGSRASGTDGQPGTVYLVQPNQVWQCITNATTFSVKPGAGSVQVLNAGTVNSTPGTSDHCILYGTLALSGVTNVYALVRFPNCVFG